VRALVTGCAGFIGSHLVDALLGDGAEVHGVDCFTENYSRAEKLWNLHEAHDWNTFSFTELDLAENDLADLVDTADVVFHLAGEPGVRPSWGSSFDLYARNNILVTQRLLETLRSSPQKRFVFASSSSVYGQAERLPTPESAIPRPLSPYGVTKLAAEHLAGLYAANHGADVVSLRYFSVYGPRQRPDMAFHQFIRSTIEGTPVTLFGDGKQIRDFTYVSDVIAATKAAATSGRSGDVLNVGAGAQVSLTHALDLICELAGRPIDVCYAPRQHGDVSATGADTTAARERLSFEPLIRLEEGLAVQFEWMLDSVRRLAPMTRPTPTGSASRFGE
jgi:UDP-glucuronate 4-epimerase